MTVQIKDEWFKIWSTNSFIGPLYIMLKHRKLLEFIIRNSDTFQIQIWEKGLYTLVGTNEEWVYKMQMQKKIKLLTMSTIITNDNLTGHAFDGEEMQQWTPIKICCSVNKIHYHPLSLYITCFISTLH